MDLLQRDRVRGYLGSGTGKRRRPGPDLPGGTHGAVHGPNVTDRKFPGNPTKSYRSKDPLTPVQLIQIVSLR